MAPSARYRKKPVVISAFRLYHDPIPDWFMGHVSDDSAVLHGQNGDRHRNGATIVTLEGRLHASPGDWIIRGVKNEIYPCKHDIFEATYEPVTTDD